MSLSVSLSPNITTFALGDSPVSVSASGGSLPDYLWESDSGTFSNRFNSNPTFTPNNATKTTAVVARRVASRGSGSAIGGVASYGSNGGWVKTSGSSASWDGAISTTSSLSFGQGFYEFEALDNSTEKAGGLLANASYRDPNLTDPTNSFNLCWHLSSSGAAIPKKAGVPLIAGLGYKAEDNFRVAIEATRAAFYMNGILVCSTTAPSLGLYGTASFRTVGATIASSSFLIDPSTNQGTSTSISVIGVFPVQPNYPYDLSADTITLSSTAEDGSTVYRVKGQPKRSIKLQFNARPYTEYQQIADFWFAHQRHLPFMFKDLVYGTSYLVTHDSPLAVQTVGPDQHTISLSLKEV